MDIQAAGDLRASLDTLDNLLMARKFEEAAALGYRDIASAFIFLQRTLGGLQDTEQRRHAFMSEIAEALRCSYEDVEPQVSARLECLKPRLDLTDEERASAEVWLRYRLRKMGSCSES